MIKKLVYKILSYFALVDEFAAGGPKKTKVRRRKK